MHKHISLLAIGFLLVFMNPRLAHASPGWQAPLANPVLVNQYLQPSSDYSAGHRGVDYLAKLGQTVLAPTDGTVKFVGRVVNRGVLTLQHTGSLITSFEPICSTLKPGDLVLRGTVIGHVCQGPEYKNHCGVRVCLHFALRTSAGYLSPLVTIGGLSPSRLLPTKP
jgi:murein DD-endopeptidase MepM/ murein hydrolase activator NlpD